jgi:RNA polymerase sigma factor (sigma-70 family)
MTIAAAAPVSAPPSDLGLLYRSEYPRVVAIARRIVADGADAEDVAQDVFAALTARRDAHELLSAEWLHRTAVRRALNTVRSRKRRVARELRAAALQAPLVSDHTVDVDPLDALVRGERHDAIRRVMRRLKPRDAALLALRYGGDLSYREIADALDVPATHVGTLLARAERAFARDVRRGPPVVALALAVTLVFVLAIVAAPPLRAVAASLIERLQVGRIVTVLITPGGASPDENVFAELYRLTRSDVHVRRTAAPLARSVEEASRRAGFRVRTPAVVPDELRAEQSAYVQPLGMDATFRFDRERARASGLELPRSLDGATVALAVGPWVGVRYGHGTVRDRLPGMGSPTVVVSEIAAPVLTVRGATLAQIASWFATQPSVPHHLAADVRALTDPLVAMPLPLRIDRERAARVAVDGVTGYAVTSFFNGSSYVVWVKGGIVYAVGGTYPLDRVLAIANSLR